jgi:hypothetical protein
MSNEALPTSSTNRFLSIFAPSRASLSGRANLYSPVWSALQHRYIEAMQEGFIA